MFRRHESLGKISPAAVGGVFLLVTFHVSVAVSVIRGGGFGLGFVAQAALLGVWLARSSSPLMVRMGVFGLSSLYFQNSPHFRAYTSLLSDDVWQNIHTCRLGGLCLFVCLLVYLLTLLSGSHQDAGPRLQFRSRTMLSFIGGLFISLHFWGPLLGSLYQEVLLREPLPDFPIFEKRLPRILGMLVVRDIEWTIAVGLVYCALYLPKSGRMILVMLTCAWLLPMLTVVYRRTFFPGSADGGELAYVEIGLIAAIVAIHLSICRMVASQLLPRSEESAHASIPTTSDRHQAG